MAGVPSAGYVIERGDERVWCLGAVAMGDNVLLAVDERSCGADCSAMLDCARLLSRPETSDALILARIEQARQERTLTAA